MLRYIKLFLRKWEQIGFFVVFTFRHKTGLLVSHLFMLEWSMDQKETIWVWKLDCSQCPKKNAETPLESLEMYDSGSL